MIRSTALALLAAACAAATLPGAAVASKGGGGGGATTTTEPSLALTSSDPPFGGTVSLSAAYSPMKWVPEVSLSCSVNEQVVYLVAQTLSGSTSATVQFTLWSQNWVEIGGAPANCTGRLYYYTWQGRTETGVVYLAQTSFVTS